MGELGLHFRTSNFRSNFASWTFFQFSKHSLMFLLSLIIFTWLAPVWYKNPGKNDAPPRAFHFPRELVLLENGCWEEKPKWIRTLFPQNSLILLLSALFFCFRQRPRGKHPWIRAEIRFRQFAFSIFIPALFFSGGKKPQNRGRENENKVFEVAQLQTHFARFGWKGKSLSIPKGVKEGNTIILFDRTITQELCWPFSDAFTPYQYQILHSILILPG